MRRTGWFIAKLMVTTGSLLSIDLWCSLLIVNGRHWQISTQRDSPRSEHGALVLGLFVVVALSLHFWHQQDLYCAREVGRIDNPMALYNSKSCGSSVDDVSKASINLMWNVVRPTPSTWRVQTKGRCHSICNKVLMCYTNEPKTDRKYKGFLFSFGNIFRWQPSKWRTMTKH